MRSDLSYAIDSETATLHFLSDIHIGSAHCNEVKLSRQIEAIANRDDSYVILIGDLIDYINYDDKRYAPREVADWLRDSGIDNYHDSAAEHLVSILEPVREKIICLGKGNHENSYERKHHYHCAAHLAKLMDVPYGGYSFFVDVTVGQQTYKVYCHHGAGAAQTPGARLMRLKQFCDIARGADLVAIGHLHDMLAKYFTSLTTVDGKVADMLQLGVMTGSFLRAYDSGSTSYAEVKGYPPNALGHVSVKLGGDQRWMSPRMWIR